MKLWRFEPSVEFDRHMMCFGFYSWVGYKACGVSLKLGMFWLSLTYHGKGEMWKWAEQLWDSMPLWYRWYGNERRELSCRPGEFCIGWRYEFAEINRKMHLNWYVGVGNLVFFYWKKYPPQKDEKTSWITRLVANVVRK